MGIVLSTYVIDQYEVVAFDSDAVRIGYNNIVGTGGVSSDQSAVGYPVNNLTRPVTYQKWRSDSVDSPSYITITTSSASPVDYFAVAGHNLGSTAATIKLQSIAGSPAFGSPEVWVDISAETNVEEDVALINQFDSVESSKFRVVITPGGSPGIAPEIGVLYIGAMTTLPRKIYAGYNPLTLNRTTEVSTGFSENGQFLGRIKRSQMLQNTLEMDYISPNWYRVNIDPFAIASETLPFFLAWRPATYPEEVGFMWLMKDIQVENTGGPDFVKISLDMQGIR